MNAKQKIHQAHLTEWAARFSAQKASGLSVRQWCDQNNLSIHKYNYWKHLLKEEVVDQMLPDIVPLSVPASFPSGSELDPDIQPSPVAADHANSANRAIRANHTNRAANTNVRLCVDGVSLELEPTISEEFLRTLIRAVHYA